MIDLRHGDCLEIMPTIPDGSVDMILCDLPYGTTACKWDVVIPFEPLWKEYKRIIKKNGAIVLFGSQPFTSTLVNSNIDMFKYEIIWEKDRPTNIGNANRQPLKKHENILVFYLSQPTYNQQRTLFPRNSEGQKRLRDAIKNGYVFKKTNNDTTFISNKMSFDPSKLTKEQINFCVPSSVVKITSLRNNSKIKVAHPTQKPVALLEYLIKTYTLEGETVMDNTMGSGSTGVACKNLNRNFIGIEKDDKYFAIAEKRIRGTMPQAKLAI